MGSGSRDPGSGSRWTFKEEENGIPGSRDPLDPGIRDPFQKLRDPRDPIFFRIKDMEDLEKDSESDSGEEGKIAVLDGLLATHREELVRVVLRKS